MTNDADAAETIAISDPLDEVLQQVSELTLRTNHLDAALKELERSVNDTGEATHTGLVEIRGLLAAGRDGSLPQDASSAVSERLDAIEAGLANAGRRSAVISILLIAVLVLEGFGLLVATGVVSFKKKSEEFSFAPPPSTATPAPPPTAVMPPPAAAPLPANDAGKGTGKDAKALHHHGHH